MNSIKTEQVIELEQPFIKVPYEQLKKSFRHSTKYIDKELSDLNDRIEKCISASERNELPLDKANTLIDELLKKVDKLNRRIQNSQKEEAQHIKSINARLENLNTITNVSSPKAPEFQRWAQLRLNRVIVDYLLREGLTDTAKKMATENGIEDMVDIQLFAQSEKVEEALQRHSCKECLQWCTENKSNLKKMRSTLEFNLRLQEHIELVRSGCGLEAVAYAKKYLVPWQATESKRIMEAMGLLAYKKDTLCEPFKSLYDPRRWQELVTQFRADNYALCSLTSHPLLSITLQAGLSAMKTTQCYQHENRNVNCPVCDGNTFGQLAEKLPLSHHVNSTVVCRISGRIMNEDNPPMLLPNGRVYSLEALKEMASQSNGVIICPRTGDTFSLDDLKKVFVS
ncbi:CTLH/CRA C-terminal to lish motif domain-domain-containing protein [Absidia repens]|uniref:CTLH/CRA C-terminal to lish motif domain-domain-containing protein n=1 Tax=Absidia repens TaxID=90262 RepID=A0A1X2IY48_9FUNG|nr:CTLH/CRA C-terminal to lish motif domain-domain-containing protein [Absidia repens]